MKVLQTIHGIDKNSGGASTYIQLLCGELAHHAAISIAAIDSGNNIELSPRVNAYFAPAPRLQSFGYSKPFRDFVFKSDADVFHGNGLWQYPVHATANAARRKKKPYIISPHGMMEPWSMTQGRLRKKLLMALFQHKDLAGATVIHATAHLEADNIRSMGFLNPLAVIPNGIDTGEFVPAPQVAARELKTLVFLSRIHPKKGLEMLIDTWRDLDKATRANWRVRIAGNGESEYLNAIKKRIRSADLQNEVEIIGPVWGADKVKLLQGADLFVLPTYSENFGIVVAEALACGVPAITTKGAPWEDLRIHKCGWWTAIDQNEIGTALSHALSMPDHERQAMGKRGRALIEKKYSIGVVAKQMMELYHWITGTNPKPAFVI